MLIQAAQADLDGSHPRAGRHLDLAARTARENLAEARALVADLAPAQLDDSTLPDALRRLSQAPEADASFALSGTPLSPPMATEVVLLRVCQEALANVRKHACAHAATVRLDYDPDAIRLEVSDDGAGFDPARVNGGYGLRGMRTRVAEAGGTLTVRSAPWARAPASARWCRRDRHPGAAGRRPSGGPRGPARHAGRRAGHRGGRRGRIRSRGGGARRAATAGRDPDGPAHAGRRRGGGHPAPGRDHGRGADHVRLRRRHPARGRGRGGRRPAEGHAAGGAGRPGAGRGPG